MVMESLKGARHFLKLLLDGDTSPRQASALLRTADARQIKALEEIIYNVLHNQDLPVPERLCRSFQKQRRWKNLKRKSRKTAHATIKKSRLRVLTLLHALREVLLDLAKR